VQATETADPVEEMRAGGIFDFAAGRGEADLAVPAPAVLSSSNVPLLIMTPPVKVLAAERSSVPARRA
jgi:hypothetical protein